MTDQPTDFEITEKLRDSKIQKDQGTRSKEPESGLSNFLYRRLGTKEWKKFNV